ncbi:MAG TPA: CPBP family intramembrane glutamic endopeptidase [Bacteroidota bacterium]
MLHHPTDSHLPPADSPEHEPSFVERRRIHPVVFAVASLVVVFLLYQIVAGTITFLLVGSTTVTRENVNLLRILTMAGQILCILLPTIFLTRLLSRSTSEVFGWRIPSLLETLYAVLGLFFLQQVFQIYLFFQDMIPVPEVLRKVLDPFRQTLEDMFRGLVSAGDLPELMLVILVVAIVPAVVEELLFRGLIQKSLERTLPGLQAALLSGIIFGLYHFNPFAVVPLVGLGCYFGILRYRSGSIVIAMTAHFFNNALAAVAVYFQIENETILGTQPKLDPNIGSILVQLLLYLTLFFVTFYGYLRATLRSDDRHSL